MNLPHRLIIGLFLFMFFSICLPVFGNDPVYEQRRSDYINNALTNFDPDAITLQAYQNVPLDSAALYDLMDGITIGTTIDFAIVKLIRILFFTNGSYDSQILPVLNSIPYWINKGDTIRNYWSENHMIMWMSSDWLLHEKYGRAIDANLYARLRHYLELKIKYGFYEFFSPTYNPYTLSGLLNLVDFSQDVQIKTLAIQASHRLLQEMLMLTNDKGVFFPAAGRVYTGKYINAYGQNHNNLIYLLTGMGEVPYSTSHAGGFLASSTLPVDTVIASWTEELDTSYHVGHSLDSGFVINSSMSDLDRIIFQWSSGAYFHPAVAQESAQLLVDSSLWNQTDFKVFQPLSFISPVDFPPLAENLSVISKSSLISGQDVAIFKHKSVTLSSVRDFWKGKVGFQQFPCVANVGTTAVYTASGRVKTDWRERNSNNANTHLPYVSQKRNVALLMYRPEPAPAILGNTYSYKDVALHWQDADFDEIVNDSLWLLGRVGQNYVGVRRSCTGEIDSVRACETNRGQSWVIMVGDSGMYGSFNNFQNIIQQSQFTENWYFDPVTSQSVYYAKIMVDTLDIEYAWGVDTIATGMAIKGSVDAGLEIFPNPASNKITMNLSSFVNQTIVIRVLNMLGQEVFFEKINNATADNKTITTSGWREGVYIITVENQERVFTQKVCISY